MQDRDPEVESSSSELSANTPDSTSTTPVAWRKWTSIILAVSALLGIPAGIGIRIFLFTTNDPMGITGDLVAVQFAWDDITGESQHVRPSNRLDQFAYATALGLVRRSTGLSFANGAELISLLSSIGLIGAMALMGYALTGRATAALIFSTFTALYPPLIQTTLRAESESPFYFFTLLAWALSVNFWRRGGWWLLAAALPMLVVSAGMRGTGLLHAGTLLVALVLASLIERPPRPGRWMRLGAIFGIVLLTVGAVAITKAYVQQRVTENYVASSGQVPEFRSYTTYIMFDGLIMGPYPGPKDWARRQEAVKGINPATGRQYENPVTMNGTPWDVIRSDPRQYALNYVLGVYETAKRYVMEDEYNLLGTAVLILGTLYLVSRGHWLALFVASGWIAVYVLIVPLLAVQDRHVRPGALGLCLPGLLLATAIVRSAFVGRDLRRATLYWSCVAVAAGFLAYGGVQAAGIARDLRFRDPTLTAAQFVQPLTQETPVVLTPTSAIVAFGGDMLARQMTFDKNEDVQRNHFLQLRPDYVFISASYRKTWQPVFDTVDKLLSSGNEPFTGELLFEERGNEVWRVHYADEPSGPDGN